MLRLLPLVLLAWAICVPAAAGLATVSGRVLDSCTGKPIPHARIGVYQSNRKTVPTDNHGRFQVQAAPGRKRLIYYDGGNPLYRSGPSTCIAVDVPAKGLSGAVLRLRAVDFAHGQVLAPSGKPLAGAAVDVWGEQRAHAVTDAKGRFNVAAPELQQPPHG